jgi:hypothetical protein
MVVVDKLPDALRDQRAGTTRVVSARARLGADSEGRTAIFVTLVLADPEGETWPVDDLWELRRSVQAVINRVDPELDVPWFMEYEPESTEQLEPEDTQELLDAE